MKKPRRVYGAGLWWTGLGPFLRKRRDSYPPLDPPPHPPLAGEHLRPLGHVSSGAIMPYFMVQAASWSSPKAWCRLRTASSMYFSSITTEVLISDVEIIWMLMLSSLSTRNILLATPT